jgi:tetratricopeptide (TPR) repeat protein
VNPAHAGERFSLLFRKFNLHDVKISRVRVNPYDDRHVLTLVAFECVGVVDCIFLVILVAHEILAVLRYRSPTGFGRDAADQFHEAQADRPSGSARDMRLLENVRLGWGSRHLLCGVFLFAFLFAPAAQSQNRQLESLMRAGQGALDAGEFARAASHFERATQMAPDNLEANRGLLLSYLQAKRLSDAENAGQSAIARWPKDAQLQHWLGLVYFKEGQNARALERLRSAENLDDTRFEVHFDAALVLLSEDQYPGAADELQKAIKLDPKAAMARVLLGRCYQNTNRTVQAIEQFQTALRLDPDIPLGHYHLAFAYASLGHNQEAVAEYEKEMRHSPDNPTVRYQLGHCLLQAGQWKSAAAQLKKAVEIDPQNSDASYDLGKTLLLEGEAEAAVPALRHASGLKPADPGPHYQLARALEKMGRKEEAQQELQTFAALKKTQPVTGGMAAGPTQ